MPLGTIVALRDRELGDPSRSETRVLALAADQVAVSLRRDQLRQAATDLEIAHQADVLKTALIDSVSHDLRTPLASIRATAGGLADPEVAWTDEARRDAASVIDTEAARLDRLVSGLLDLSKIASGGLHPDLEPHELWSVVLPVVERLRPSLGERSISVDVPESLPPVLADAVLLDIVVTNLLDNVGAHSAAGRSGRDPRQRRRRLGATGRRGRRARGAGGRDRLRCSTGSGAARRAPKARAAGWASV